MYSRIKELRLEFGRATIEIAGFLCISLDDYRKLEAGEIECMSSYVISLANLYNVSCDYIYGRTDIRDCR